MTTTAASLADIDQSDMLDAIAGLPAQLRDGYERAGIARDAIERAWPAGSHGGTARPRTLVVCGMGGSGVGGDLLPAVFDVGAPVVAVKGYDIPSWVGDEDRVVCVSYSGETAETLSCFEQARSQSVVAACITTGGTLGAAARDADVPVVKLPAGLQPRAAVGVIFGALAGVAESLNIVEHARHEIDQAARGAQLVVDMHTGVADPDGTTPDPSDDPPALVMARDIGDATPVIYGAGITAAIAHRWKAQVNENSKMPAFANSYPELDHNEIVGWTRATAGGARWALVELVPANVAPEIRKRMDVTRELIADDTATVLRLDAMSVSRAGAVFELIAWGDYLSTYLALVHGVDPTPVERIQALKARLAGA